jgi:hypothetical protein
MGHGWAWAPILNGATRDSLYSTTGAPDFDAGWSRIFTRDALQSVSWLDGDLFPQYLPAGRPAIFPEGVVNRASGQPTAVVPGELVTIFGTFLGPANGTSMKPSADGFVPTDCSGTEVLVNGAPRRYSFPRHRTSTR